MHDDRDPLLDALLSEALGGHTPPDLTARILQAAAARGIDPARLDPRLLEALSGAPLPPPRVTDTPYAEPLAPPVAAAALSNGHMASPIEPAAPRVSIRKRGRKAPPAWLAPAVAASVLIGGSLVGYVVVSQMRTPVADNTVPRDTKKQNDTPRVTPPRRTPPVTPNNEQPPKFEVAEKPTFARKLPKSDWQDLSPSSDTEVIAFVNTSLRAAWTENKVQPSPPASDAEWCERVYQRLIGRAPQAEELAAFTADASADKRAALVERLLTDDKYAAEFARHFAAQWATAMLGRGEIEAERVAGLERYLADAIQKNQPYDQIVQALVTATGSPRENPAANYLLALADDEHAAVATARTAQAFLGKQLSCAQCHDAPAGATQQQFWALNGFFRQLAVERGFGGDRLVNRDFRGERGDDDEAEVYYEQPGGLLKAAYPAFVDGTPSARSGRLKDVDRRAELAALLAASDDLSRALVNRTWAQFFGYGFTRPADDLGDRSKATHPAVLERLAKEFKAHGYDTKDLARWIALSEPFGLSSKTNSTNLMDSPQLGGTPLFSHFYTRQLPTEAPGESLVAVAEIAARGGTAAEKEQARLVWLGQSRRTEGGGSAIPAVELIQPVISTEHGRLIDRIAGAKLTADQQVEHLFLSALGRAPSRDELSAARKLFAADGDAREALTDIWWALLNSNEYRE